MIDSSITFTEEGLRRHVTYVNPRIIEMLGNGAVKIRCKDGFQIVISARDSFTADRWKNKSEEC